MSNMDLNSYLVAHQLYDLNLGPSIISIIINIPKNRIEKWVYELCMSRSARRYFEIPKKMPEGFEPWIKGKTIENEIVLKSVIKRRKTVQIKYPKGIWNHLKHPMAGKKHSEKSCLKMKMAKKGRKFEEIYGIEGAMKLRDFRSNQMKNLWKNPEFRKTIIEKIPEPWNKGLTKEDDTRLSKISKDRSGKGNPMYNQIPWNKGKTWLDDDRIAHGDGNGLWKGGVWLEPYDSNFFALRDKVRERDKYICQICGIHQDELDEALNVHHIDENKENNDIDNLVSLCRLCHVNLHHENLELTEGG